MPPEVSISRFEQFLADHSALLKFLHEQAKAARWNLSCEEFAAALYRSAAHHLENAPAEAVESYLEAVHLEDLALACALRNGSELAWEQFVSEYRPVLRAAARAIVGKGGEERARELADSLYAELYGLDRKGNERKTSLLDYFHGRSRLSTWLRTVLAQRHVDGLRASQRTQPQDVEAIERSRGYERGNSEIDDLDPDRARLLPLLAAAVSKALAALPAADRLLLLLYYVQGLKLAQIARMLAAHEATASRRLQKIRADLRQRVEAVLAAGSAAQNGGPPAKGLSPAEVRACLDYALEDWPFDLTPLAEDTAQETSERK